MDFRGLSRRQLQALCKRNGIPANTTNVAMADGLQALQTVERMDEIEERSPELRRSSQRISARRGPISFCRACPGCMGTTQYSPIKKRAMEEEEGGRQGSHEEVSKTPANSNRQKTQACGTPSTRRRAAKKEKIKSLESLVDAAETPFPRSPRIKSSRRLLSTPVEEEEKETSLRSYKRSRSSSSVKKREEEIEFIPSSGKRFEVLTRENAEDEDSRDLTTIGTETISGEKATAPLLELCPRITVELKEEFGGIVNAAVASEEIKEGTHLITQGIKKCQNEAAGAVNSTGSGSKVKDPKDEGQKSEIRSVVELDHSSRKETKGREQEQEPQLAIFEDSSMRGLVKYKEAEERTVQGGRTNSDVHCQESSCQLLRNETTENENNQFSGMFPATYPPPEILNSKANGGSSETESNRELVATSVKTVFGQFPAIDCSSCDDQRTSLDDKYPEINFGQIPTIGCEVLPESEALYQRDGKNPNLSNQYSVDPGMKISSELPASGNQTPPISGNPGFDDQKANPDVAVTRNEFSSETLALGHHILLEFVSSNVRCDLDGNGEDVNLDQHEILKQNKDSSHPQPSIETSCATLKLSGEIPAGRNLMEFESIPNTSSSPTLQKLSPLQSSHSIESPDKTHPGAKYAIGDQQGCLRISDAIGYQVELVSEAGDWIREQLVSQSDLGVQSPHAAGSPAKISLKVKDPMDVAKSWVKSIDLIKEQKISLPELSLNTSVAMISPPMILTEEPSEINSGAKGEVSLSDTGNKFHRIGVGVMELKGGSEEMNEEPPEINSGARGQASSSNFGNKFHRIGDGVIKLVGGSGEVTKEILKINSGGGGQVSSLDFSDQFLEFGVGGVELKRGSEEATEESLEINSGAGGQVSSLDSGDNFHGIGTGAIELEGGNEELTEEPLKTNPGVRGQVSLLDTVDQFQKIGVRVIKLEEGSEEVTEEPPEINSGAGGQVSSLNSGDQFHEIGAGVMELEEASEEASEEPLEINSGARGQVLPLDSGNKFHGISDGVMKLEGGTEEVTEETAKLNSCVGGQVSLSDSDDQFDEIGAGVMELEEGGKEAIEEPLKINFGVGGKVSSSDFGNNFGVGVTYLDGGSEEVTREASKINSGGGGQVSFLDFSDRFHEIGAGVMELERGSEEATKEPLETNFGTRGQVSFLDLGDQFHEIGASVMESEGGSEKVIKEPLEDSPEISSGVEGQVSLSDFEGKCHKIGVGVMELKRGSEEMAEEPSENSGARGWVSLLDFGDKFHEIGAGSIKLEGRSEEVTEEPPEINVDVGGQVSLSDSGDKFHGIGAGVMELEGGSKEAKWRQEPISIDKEIGAPKAQTEVENPSAKKDLDSLSLRKLKILYRKKRKKVGVISLAVEKGKEEKEEEQTEQKSYLNDFSLRKLRMMYKVAAKNKTKV